MRKGVTLRVTAKDLGKVIEDLDGTFDFMSSVNGVVLVVRKSLLREDETEPMFVVELDKHQRAYLENQMTVQAFADQYGEARDDRNR